MLPSITLGIHLSIKFRIFNIDLGKYENSATLSYAIGTGFKATIVGVTPPSNTTTIFNEHGVFLQVWEAASL